jgi:hypothetical protein
MAEKVVGFQIEIKGNKELLTTEKILGLVNNQLTLINKNLDEINKKGGANLGKLSKQFKESATSAQKLGTIVKSSFESFEKGNKVVRDLGNGYFEVTKQIDNLGKEYASSSNSAKALIARNKELKSVLEAAPIDEQSEELEKLRSEYTKNDKAIKSFRKELRTGIKEQEASKGSLVELKKRAKELKSEYDLLTPSQRKFTLGGRNLRRQLLKTNKSIKSYNNSIRASSGLSKTLGKSLTRLFVGRSILSGAANVLRGVATGLSNIVTEGSKTDKTLAGIANAGKGLTSTLQNTGKSFLSAFGGVISSVIENVSFVIFKVSESLKDSANSGGLFSTVLNGIGSILSNFPAIFGGVIEVVGEFKDRFTKTLTEIGLGIQKVIASAQKLGTVLTGGDTTAINERLASINKQLEKNVVFARTIGDAYKEGYDATKQAQEEFNTRTEEEVVLQEKREKAAIKSEERRKKAAEAEKKRIEELAKDRNELLKEIEANAQARIELTITLNNELRDAEIASIKDTEEQAIQAEKIRFERQKQARLDAFNELKKDTKAQEEEIKRLAVKGSTQLADFQEKTGAEILSIKQQTDRLIEAEAKQHQENLDNITKTGIEQRKAIVSGGFASTLSAFRSGFKQIAEITKKGQEEAAITEAEANAKRRKQAKEVVALVNVTLDGISQISNAAFQAEDQRFQESLSRRQENIQALNEDLQNATGLQKKFLKQQIEQEKKALDEETEAREKARKEQAKAQQAIAITQAIIGAALGFINAFQLGPPASFIAAAATAVATVAQIGVIASQKFAKGGVLSGPSHAQGGIKTSFGELEGGEAVINKNSTAKFKPLLSKINVAGGGKKFAEGGLLGAPISAPSLSSGRDANQDFNTFLQQQQAQTEAINARFDRIQVIQDLNNLEDIQDNDSTLNTLTTFN